MDLSILDFHYGTIDMWRTAINEIHARGMYVILDNTFATLSDLIGFEGYLNTTTPFLIQEHQVVWKTERQYHDFEFGNSYNKTCEYPRFYEEDGYPVGDDVMDKFKGCYDSEFDQYGDTEAFGVYPDWRRQLTKFASVQDRLREWHAPVRAKLENFYCMSIAQLDVDGYRYDKATQSTVDALGFANDAMRKCARKYGKENFFIPGEITGGNVFGSLYVGRGRQPDMTPDNLVDAVQLSNTSDSKFFIREPENSALDAAAFHYTVYRTLTRFLGMSGNLEAGYDAPTNWVDMWNSFLVTNDMVNANTGRFDPRHMFGVTNQDVFRWPAIRDGVHRQLLGHFITSITLPGIPLLLWGEEQAFYVLDNTAENYIFGRAAMSSATAWQNHGCYRLNSSQYYNFKDDVEAARHGCEDDSVSLDHRDPSHPVRNIIRRMFQLRKVYPVLQDGFFLQQLSNQTEDVLYIGSNTTVTETGLWSVMRSGFSGLELDGIQQDFAPVWLIYSNLNRTKDYQFDCKNNDTNLNITALIAPYDSGTTVRNLFYPYDEQTLEDSSRSLGINGSSNPNGCLSSLSMSAYEFRAYVPAAQWIGPQPMITKFTPGHDARITSTVSASGSETLDVQLYFNVEMDCDSVTRSISSNSTTISGNTFSVENAQCTILSTPDVPPYVGAIASTWSWSATLTGVENGIHRLTVSNATTSDGTSTDAVDHFLLRVGQDDNPMVFPRANYSSTLLLQNDDDKLYISHKAAGADMWRYSTNWGTSFSDWMPYKGGNTTLEKQPWSGTKRQEWQGEHVRAEYFSRMAGSSDHVQEGDLGGNARRFPHLFLNGPYNQYGYDAGLANELSHVGDSEWSRHFMTEWPALAQLNVWGINPDGKPDQTNVMGDIDGDSVLDRLPPSSLASVILNITLPPPKPYLGWRVVVNDGTLRFQLLPSGSMYPQMALYILLWIVPVIGGSIAVWAYMQGFYQVKFNQIGVAEKGSLIPLAIKRPFKKLRDEDTLGLVAKFKHKTSFMQSSAALAGDSGGRRRTVLIATMEYDIEDWAIKIKIGGLGVMAQLMGKNLGHQDLIWVVPCVGGVDYPTDNPIEPMEVTILGVKYEVQVQTHVLRNITYVLLDAPVFRQQTKAEPYPPRMDDLSSAIYYSAWNQCIGQALRRFPIDLYHINDYHGTVAPLYLLPDTIPAALSLHNAEFQGLWPMRTKKERNEVCSVFNLPLEVVQKYVQFGEVFNLLHAGASYLRVHQQGFGAVGVSKKYGKRSYARYPIFWGLKKVGQLPNPDPSDTAAWDRDFKETDIRVDPAFEDARPELKRQAQEWAGLEQDPDAELFVFVGRWSMQKGVDLIADVFPSILESTKSQLICVGPVIDLYGKFAALKLEKMMQIYPGRVCSKPVFTALPPFIFSGAEFALIPSRDEPFGLVAVEFGRKGALGVGARVGGLGQMPGWWYTVESMTTSHLTNQFREAIREALASKTETRAMMRARSAKQRFPVQQWVEDLEILQSGAIRIHDKEVAKHHKAGLTTGTGYSTPMAYTPMAHTPMAQTPLAHSRNVSYAGLNTLANSSPASNRTKGEGVQTTMGSQAGPGHRGAPQDDVHTHEEREAGELPEALAVTDTDDAHDMASMSVDEMEAHLRSRLQLNPMPSPLKPAFFSSPNVSHTNLAALNRGHDTPPMPGTPGAESFLLPPSAPYIDKRASSHSVLSMESVVGEKKDFKLQQVDPFFTDSTGEFYKAFEKKLEGLNGQNSDSAACIEDYIMKSEKEWFTSFRNAKLGRTPKPSRPSSLFHSQRPSAAPSFIGTDLDDDEQRSVSDDDVEPNDEFLLGRDYTPPTGLKKWMQIRVGDWPVYAFFLGFGQIIAANSYQITLLTGTVGQAASKLYTVASIYLVTSIMWWILYRRFKSVISLSLPFLFYGFAFFFIGVAHYANSTSSRGWIQNVGTACYAIASSSGSIFFALNFGDEGGATVSSWVYRACVIQGTQQMYVVALWYWGSYLTRQTAAGLVEANPLVNSWKITAITLPLALLLWAIGLIMFYGLPVYYRQSPGNMPSFYVSLMRRKIVLWFFVTVVIQNFFLSAPYGRNWSFLWSSNHASGWQVMLLVLLFFIGVWAAFLWGLSILSKDHSWILPMFAIGLGAPRWAQIWWATSGIGQWLPWAGGYTSGALLSRSIWLWLGVLDSVQGVGLGMILLGTLTRVHVAFTLITAQVLGSIATMVGRAVAPNNLGPGPISPDISSGLRAMAEPWFFIGLFFNLLICGGYFLFFRKEQLSKP